jgi:hypothetical protein
LLIVFFFIFFLFFFFFFFFFSQSFNRYLSTCIWLIKQSRGDYLFLFILWMNQIFHPKREILKDLLPVKSKKKEIKRLIRLNRHNNAMGYNSYQKNQVTDN